MADTHVLVPMQLDALVLNQEASLAIPFLRFQMDYVQLQSFGDPEPAPFAGASTAQPGAGIYLHWTLPQSLRQGVHTDDQTTFPLVPNRWLVSRVQAGAPAAQAVKAWIIESDYVDATAGSSPFVDPAGLNEYGTTNPTKIGRARLLPVVTGLDGQPRPFLRAMGPGSVFFSVFEPGIQNVFAFQDSVTAADDTTPIDQASFTYSVVGWYSDAPHDPLSGTTWEPNPDENLPGTFVNSELPWYVYATSASLPTQTLTHAMVSAVPWDRNAENPPAANYPTDVPNTVRVAVGNTAVDALAAIVRLDQNSQAEADLLEAFQYSLLDQFDQPGSSEALNLAIRQHWYGASSGGTLWSIVDSQRTDNTALPAPPRPVVSVAEQTALAALNTAQRQLDRQQRVLDSMQWTLFGLWWRNQWQQYNNPPVDGDTIKWLSGQLPLQVGIGSSAIDSTGTDPTKEEWYVWKVQAQQNLVSQLQGQADGAASAIRSALDPTLELKATNLPQYFAPQDPVVLVTGLGRATNLDPVDGALCRLPSQMVASLTVGGTAYTAASLAGRIPVLADPHGVLPDGVQALHTESFFLAAALFAQDILGGAAQASAVEQAIQALPAPAAGGQFPPLAFAFPVWAQPWVPLLLDWRVTVLKEPAYTTAANQPTPTFNQANWQFDGSDYRWIGPTTATGTNFAEADSGQMTLSGRTFVTPHLSVALAAQLDQYVKTHSLRDPSLEALLEALDTYIDGIAGQDILSQRLSGFRSMMSQRAYTQTVVPSGDITARLGNAQRGIPMPFPDQHAEFAPAVWDFAPLGGSFFVVQGLTVIDVFGRTIDLMLANYSTDPLTQGSVSEFYFYPIAGRNVQAPTAKPPAPGRGISQDPTTRMLQLTPGPIQESQLRFRLLSNDGRNRDIDEEAGANPICGWLVPNHLDRSLSFYAPDGLAWGELYLSAQVGGAFVPSWQPDPTNPAAPQTVEAIPNEYVRGMLHAVWNRTDNGVAFSDFLELVDQTLWTINPPGDKNDRDLAVLVGRPLAIVRAEVSLRLSGLPQTSQDWWNLFSASSVNTADPTQAAQLAALDGGAESFTWPVRLGSSALRNDGLIGYYLDDPAAPSETYAAFNTVLLPPELQTNYLKQIGQGNYPQLRLVDDSATVPDPARQQVARLTMLVDPRGSIHAFTGLLPVASVEIPSQFVTSALNTISYLFRAGPLLTVPDLVRLPRPAETRGTWGWFDNVLDAVLPLTPADANATITATTPLIKEGWLKFTPNPPPPTPPPDAERG